MLKVNFWNDAADFDIVTGKYIGFLAYPKNKCAIDFVDAFMDGRVTWKMYDYESYYIPQYIYKRQDGRHTSVTMQFYRSYVGDRDLPSSEKKDQLYLVLEGLDTVDFGTKVMLECLEGIQAGTKAASDGDNNEDFTPCAAWDKDLGW